MISKSNYPKNLIFSAVLLTLVVAVSGCIGSYLKATGGQFAGLYNSLRVNW